MHINSFLALFYKECRRFFRVIGQSVFTPVMNSSLYLLIFGVSLAKNLHLFAVPYLEFLIPGLMMMGAINNGYMNSCSSLIIAKYYGDIEDLKISPLSATTIISAMSLASMVRAVIVASVIFLTGQIFVKIELGSFFIPCYPLYMLYFIAISGFSFGLLGLIVGLYARSFEMLNGTTQFILLPLIYLGGVFYPVNFLPPLWQKLAHLNPMLYYISGMRYACFGVSDVSFLSSLVVTIAFLSLLFIVAHKVVKVASFRRIG